MTEPLLHTTAIAKSFGPVVALRSVALSVQPGEVHALLGANGAGKSTMVKILTGVLRPDSGDIAVNGAPVQLRKPSDARRHGLAPVFQDPALVPDLTIRENLRLTGTDIGEVRRQLTDMDLSGLDLDELVRDVPLPFLRMLDLARAMSLDPQLLLLDEITAALPPDCPTSSSTSCAGGSNAIAACCSSRIGWPRSASTATCAPCCATAARWPRSSLARAGSARSCRPCWAKLRPPSVTTSSTAKPYAAKMQRHSSRCATWPPDVRCTTSRSAYGRVRCWAWWPWRARARTCCSK